MSDVSLSLVWYRRAAPQSLSLIARECREGADSLARNKTLVADPNDETLSDKEDDAAAEGKDGAGGTCRRLQMFSRQMCCRPRPCPVPRVSMRVRACVLARVVFFLCARAGGAGSLGAMGKDAVSEHMKCSICLEVLHRVVCATRPSLHTCASRTPHTPGPDPAAPYALSLHWCVDAAPLLPV